MTCSLLKTSFWEIPIVLRSGGGWVGHDLSLGEVDPAEVGEMGRDIFSSKKFKSF
jgi:hypothetical protein